MKKYTSALTILSAMLIVLPMLEATSPAFGASEIINTTTLQTTPQSKLDALKTALQENPNFLQYTEYKMFKRKNPGLNQPTDYYYDDEYSLRPYGASALSKEYSGGFFGPDQTGLGESLDVITGAKAVDESMQIGSIGAERNAVSTNNRRQVEMALELYFNDKAKYPETLAEMRPMYIGSIPPGFTYKNLGTSYQLDFGDITQGQTSIAEVKPLEIKTHPWDSMVKTTPKIPDMFSLVPADDLLIYFRDLNKFTELEQTITAIGKPMDSIYNLSNSIEVKNKIFKRLGIKDIPELRKFIDEAGLVAYDMDAYPNTDYALILKVKSSLFNSFVSDFISAPKDRQAQINGYYVVATDSSFLETIKTAKGSGVSLAKEKDLAYALSVLEKDYDGFTYLSEKFIQKLTSPAYRINARRRNTVLNALETWQYTVFAYKDITGAWPKSLQQIVDEGYINPDSFTNLTDYSVNSEGVVQHKDWGSIYDVTPIQRVAISTVSAREKTLYESFKEGYQQYWREFIDPVGVAITVGDQIRFHTIILPLIDKSEYNWIKDIAGNDGITFDFLKNPDRLPSLQLIMKLNVDDSIYAYYKSMGKYSDEEYNKCTTEYYKTMDWNNPNRKSIDEVCKYTELPKAEAVTKIKKQIAKALDWQESTQVLDFIDNEVTLAGGENLVFNIEDLSNFDMYFAVEMKDQAMAKKFIEKLFAWYAKQNSGGENKKVGYGFFSLDTNKPVKNTYNNTEYYLVPLGFTNIYYSFINSRLYLTISQSAMNRIIDGGVKKGTKEPTKWPAHMTRLFDYLGDNMNLAFIADNTKLQSWLKGAIKDQWLSYSATTDIKNIKSYYAESFALAKSLDSNATNIDNVSKYYRLAPKQWFDAGLGMENGKAYLESQGQKYFLEDIDLGYSYYQSRLLPKQDQKEKTKLTDITKNFNVDKTLAEWEKLKDLGIGFNLTKEGLDIRIAFNNVASDKLDKRVGKSSNYGTKINWPLFGGVGGGIIAFSAVAWFFLRRKKQLLPTEPLPDVPTPSKEPEMITPFETQAPKLPEENNIPKNLP